MAITLLDLLSVYPHIRCGIFQTLRPSEVFTLCQAVGYILDQFDKKRFLNPISEVFNPSSFIYDNKQILLIGDNIRQLTSRPRPGIKLYAYIPSRKRCTINRGIGIINHHTSSSVLPENNITTVVYYDPDVIIGICDINVALTNSSVCNDIRRWRSSNINTLNSTYEIECVILSGNDWWFSKVIIEFTETIHPPEYDDRVTVWLNMTTYIYQWAGEEYCDGGSVGVMYKKVSM